jgi:hypothetical protein
VEGRMESCEDFRQIYCGYCVEANETFSNQRHE